MYRRLPILYLSLHERIRTDSPTARTEQIEAAYVDSVVIPIRLNCHFNVVAPDKAWRVDITYT